MAFIGKLLNLAIDIYTFIVVAQVILQWLIRFEVISTRNPQAAKIVDWLDRAVEPVYAWMRRTLKIPPIGGIDISPIILILALHLLQVLIVHVMVM